MIRTDKEYKVALQRINEERARAKHYRQSLEQEGLDAERIQRLMDPIEAFHGQLRDDVEWYEKARKHEFAPTPLRGLGRLLIGLRIAKGWTQHELANAQGVQDSTVSRDENREYPGLTVDRAQRVLDALEDDVLVMTRTMWEAVQARIEVTHAAQVEHGAVTVERLTMAASSGQAATTSYPESVWHPTAIRDFSDWFEMNSVPCPIGRILSQGINHASTTAPSIEDGLIAEHKYLQCPQRDRAVSAPVGLAGSQRPMVPPPGTGVSSPSGALAYPPV